MALFPRSLDYTDKDFDALEARIQNLIRSVFPDWTDEEVADFGNILIDGFCFVGDVLTKYQDTQVRETRWTQAQARKSLLALVKLIGYEPRGASAATVDQTFSISAATAGDVVFTAGSEVYTEDVSSPTRYQLLEDATILAGETSVVATCENSETTADGFTSSGLSSQSFLLTSTPYVDDSATVVAGDGAYTQVRNFIGSSGTDKHFTVTVDSQERARIAFGNGVNGQIPNGNILVTYKTGGGKAGRVEANKLRRIAGTFTDTLGNPVTVTVNNADPSSGGEDRETNEQIRENAPEQSRVSDRNVAREDFEITARSVAGVSRALHLTSNEDPGVDENAGLLFIVPVGVGVASDALLDAVAAAFVPKPYAPTFQLRIQTAPYLTVNVNATIFRRPGVANTKAVVKASVLAALAEWFAPEDDDGTKNELVDFGHYFQDSDGNPTQEIAWSDIFDVVKNAAGVRKVGAGDFFLNGERDDVTIANQQFPKLGTVTLIDGDDGTVL